MNFIDYLFKNRKHIYCANGLFSPLNRIGGYNVAHTIDTVISENYNKYENHKFSFLPFRDTQQDEIISENKSKIIYDLDIQNLKKSGAIIGRLDGIAKDSGVCMEIGYAYSMGIPIGVFSTDFICESFPSHIGCPDLDFDPIVTCISTYQHHYKEMPNGEKLYEKQNQDLENYMVSDFINTCLCEFDKLKTFINPPVYQTNNDLLAYVDIQGGKYEWAKEEQNQIFQKLTSFGLQPMSASRYNIGSNVLFNAKVDLDNLLSSKLAIFSADNIEMDTGSAVLFGISVGLNIKTVLLYTSPVVLKGAGGQVMKQNLMIEQAADIVCSSKKELYLQIKKEHNE